MKAETMHDFYKACEGINFDETIDLTAYLSKNISKKLKIVYELYGIIYHFENENNEHNSAFCKIKGEWYRFDNEMIQRISFDRMPRNHIVLMFYKKINKLIN